MKVIDCKACGSKELVEESGVVVCVYCQTRYVPGPQDAPQVDSEISVGSDVQALLQRCRDDPANSRRYASLVLDIDPTNAEARQFLMPAKKKKWWQ